MKTASPELIAFLATATEYYMAELFTFTLVGGFVVRYTDCDVNLVYEGNTYRKFGISREGTKSSIGLSVDELKVKVVVGPTDMLNGRRWVTAVRYGALDSANLLVQRIYMPTMHDMSLGAIHKFDGRVADVPRVGRSGAEIVVKSPTENLDTQLPRNLFQPGCLNSLYDLGCGKNRADFAVEGVVTTADVTQIDTPLLQAVGYFSLGTIEFTSGVNEGIKRSVRHFEAGRFVLARELVTAPGPGDTFVAHPGCDRTKSTCTAKFDNLVNFVGFPYVPDPETAL